MDIPALNLRSLYYLQAVERYGTFTEAAWELGISQPALSQSVAELSKRLGAPLFRKEGRRRVLTEAGQRVVRYADRVTGQTSDLVRWLDNWQRGEVGSLRVGLIDTVGLYTLPSGLSRLQTELPEIELQLVVAESEDLLSMLDRYRVDLALVVGPAGSRYNSEAIATERMHVYALGDDTVATRNSGPEVAPPAGWALYPPASRTRLLIDQGLARLGIHPEVALESAHPTVLRQMAVLGYARTVLPQQVAAAGEDSDLSEGPLVALRPIEAVWRSGEDLDPRAARLIEFVKEENPPAAARSRVNDGTGSR